MLSNINPKWLFLMLSTLTALVGAFVHPVMSLFFVQGIKSPPAFFGLYTIAVTVAGLMISQWFGAKADRGASTLKMYMLAILTMACGLVIYGALIQTNSASFSLFIVIGVMFIAMGSAAIPQMLTLARQWSNDVGSVDITQFNARLRAAISIAWVVGPAIGFSVVAYSGFTVTFYLAGLCGILAAFFAYRCIPKISVVNLQQQKHSKQSQQKAPLSFWLLVGATTCGSAANVLYSAALPLYTIEELNFSPVLPGLFIATVALLEIPIILLSSQLARMFNKVKLLMISFGLGAIFYTGIYFSDSVWQFFALQVVNAVSYGLFAGLSLTFLQEQLPSRVGFTSAICSNAFKVGMMLGSTAMGLIAQFLSFRHANIGALFAVFLGFLCLVVFSYLKSPQRVSE